MNAPEHPEAEVTATGEPLMIVVGGDALALSTAREILGLHGHRVVVLWHADAEFAHAVEAIGAAYVAARPDSVEGLDLAGVVRAVTILALSRDDRLNLHAALLARDANPRIRIVLRQFNRSLARKVEQNLRDCSVLSLAWQSAASYAAAAIDPNCFRGLQFPEPGGPLTGFAWRRAAACGVVGKTLAEAERALGARIVAVDGEIAPLRDTVLGQEAALTVFAAIGDLEDSAPRRPVRRDGPAMGRRLGALLRRVRRELVRANPIFAPIALAALVVFAFGAWHFHAAFGSDWLNAAYFVLSTMTTTGYGDLTPNRHHPADILAAMLLMMAGITFSGLFIAFVSAQLTRIQWISMQGLRAVHRRGHIVVCGAGSIGSNVIELLRDLGKPLVVVETAPEATLVEEAHEQGFDILTGDASRDATLDLCNLGRAHALISLTNVDTLNLEIALAARARNPSLPIVLRIADAGFATSIARHFEFETTFSAEALAAPAFAGLSRIPGARGRVAFAGQELAIGEIEVTEAFDPALLGHGIPIARARAGALALVHDLEGLAGGDRLLAVFPLAPFQRGEDSFAVVAERYNAAYPSGADRAG